MSRLPLFDAMSPNHDERREALDMLVLHYTGMRTGEAALERLCDPDAKVSAHYLVEEDGRIFRLVDEGKRAWHAGVARWDGREDVNSRSIGVEIVNGGHDFGLPAYPDVQIQAVIALCRDVLERRRIPQSNIVGHSDIAPARKMDPGEHFPWERLSANGIGLWPKAHHKKAEPALESPEARVILEAIGYGVENGAPDAFACAVRAFQRRWRPSRVDGLVDPETLQRMVDVADAFARDRGAGGVKI